jgi:hypothetical protein
MTDAALGIADDHDRRKTEAPTALDDLGNAIDANQLFDEFAFLTIARLPI